MYKLFFYPNHPFWSLTDQYANLEKNNLKIEPITDLNKAYFEARTKLFSKQSYTDDPENKK